MRGLVYNLDGELSPSRTARRRETKTDPSERVSRRETVALLLHTPDRADWKRCAKSDDEEKKDCQRFKAGFKKFDPST